MQIDSDDLFINENLFDICYEEAEKNNMDILEFSGFRRYRENISLIRQPIIPLYLKYKYNNLFVTQPKLSSFVYTFTSNIVIRLIDGYLWGKCIRNEIYKKTLDTLGEDIYTRKMFYGDDRLVVFVLFKVANSFKFINLYGIAYNYSPTSIMHVNDTKIRNCHDELFNIMSIYNYTKNTSDIIIAAYEIVHRWKTIIFPGLNEDNKQYLNQLMEKLVKSPQMTEYYKRRLIFYWETIKNETNIPKI